ncbi:MAG: aspartate-semialdehyde dehydrogenase [Candidatus Geothermincolia bacterium]
MSNGYRIAVAGATGAVGTTMLRILEERGVPVAELRPLASERSRGKKVLFRGEEVPVQVMTEESFEGIEYALFSAGSARSREFAPAAVRSGAVVIDNSSAFRMRPEVPLVVPEVNPHALSSHEGIISNPNCSTIPLVLVLHPLNGRQRVRRVVVSTYQSVSGTGTSAIEELKAQSLAVLQGAPLKSEVYPHQIAFNCLPQIESFVEGGYTTEELKLLNETRKIMEAPDIAVSPTAIRVPVMVGHSASVNIEFEAPLSPDDARAILRDAPGVVVQDEPEAGIYPMAVNAAGRDACFVGRIREDISCERGLNLWVVSDNLRKGAALNAVQILEELVRA